MQAMQHVLACKAHWIRHLLLVILFCCALFPQWLKQRETFAKQCFAYHEKRISR